MECRKKAVLLKSPSSSDGQDAYARALEEIGISAVCVPVLDFSFLHLSELWNALCKPNEYSGLILTSPRAVQSVSLAIEQAGSDASELWQTLLSTWQGRKTFVIGEATATAAKELGLVTIGSDSGNAESLVPLIVKESEGCQCPLLFPCGNLRREVIPKHLDENNVPFHSIVTYKTVKHGDILENIRKTCTGIQPEYMVFYSPSGVSFTLPILKELGIDIHKIKCVAIGPTTGQSLQKTLDAPPAAVATKPSPVELKSAVMSIINN